MKNWIKAFRLRTLPLALSCILAGHAAAAMKDNIDWSIFVWSIITTVFLQILSNLANDFGDAEHGADHDLREGPSRTVQAGLISKSAMAKAVLLFAILSLVAGTFLLSSAIASINLNFLLFFLLGIASIAAAIKYTMGKNPYGYKAMGDIFVFVFFGLVGVLGSSWLQTQKLYYTDFYLACAVGFFSVAVLNMNNMRDVESDQKAGKITIPILLGGKDKWYHMLLILLGALNVFLFLDAQQNNWYFLGLLLLLPFISNVKKVLNYQSRQDLDPELKKIAIGTFINALFWLVSVSIGQ